VLSSVKNLALFFFLSASSFAADPAANVLYANNFERTAVDTFPDEFMVMAGTFGVKEENGNHFLELPGAPLDTFGLLFGPGVQSDVGVSARFLGSKQGRKFPTFGLSINGVGGYRLQASPAKKALEIYKADEAKASVPYEWQSDAWTSLRIRVRTTDKGCIVEGKAWRNGETEPTNWAVTFQDNEQPPSGRAGIWGSPYSGKPIRFDDFLITKEK
jgi:hypothetical protein